MSVFQSSPVSGEHRSVLVVGAGPVGLAAALALRAREVPVTVLEAEAKMGRSIGSRAIYIHRSSLELLEGLRPGLGRTLADAGLVWATKRTFWRGREVYSRTYPPLDPEVLPPFSSLPQEDIEQLLLDACKNEGVEFVTGTRVNGVEVKPDGVMLTTEGGVAWEADYVVGADGARSAVRKGIGATMQGDRSENWFIVVDIADTPDVPSLPIERHFHYEHPAVDGRHVLIVPFTGGWRVDLQCRREDDYKEFSSPDGVKAWLSKVVSPEHAEHVTWVSTYQFLQLVADSLTDEHRRVLLIGEACHLFAPFGARGMNSGIEDADAAGDAIAGARSAASPEESHAAVDRFARQRKRAAQVNRDAASTALQHMQARDPVVRARRRLALMLAPRSSRARRWLDEAPYGPRREETLAAQEGITL
ncbi:MAG: NAD(P)-binding protein [Nitriliruptorales bacterium]|nr:NAD(P)-binding protein [Nitriliruptorales bacterium]